MPSNMKSLPTLAYTADEACKLLRISRFTFNVHMNDGTIRVVRLGKRVLVTAEEIDRILGRTPAEPKLPVAAE